MVEKWWDDGVSDRECGNGGHVGCVGRRHWRVEWGCRGSWWVNPTHIYKWSGYFHKYLFQSLCGTKSNTICYVNVLYRLYWMVKQLLNRKTQCNKLPRLTREWSAIGIVWLFKYLSRIRKAQIPPNRKPQASWTNLHFYFGSCYRSEQQKFALSSV